MERAFFSPVLLLSSSPNQLGMHVHHLLMRVETMEWVEASVFGEKPSPRGYHSVTLHDNRLFVIGGTSGEDYNNDIYILDLGCYSWLQMQKPVL
jgi:Kelch motif